MADHLRLDLNLVELLSGVDTDDAANHLRHDDHVSQVSLDQVGLLVGLGLLLGLPQLLDQAHRLALETAVEPTAGAGVDDIAQLVRGEVEESVQREKYRVSFICSPLNFWVVDYLPTTCVSRWRGMGGGCVLVEVDATVRELAEGSLLLDLGSLNGILRREMIVS